MLSVIIQEKGAVDKRIPFDKPELTIGRVQGNDLVLAKGNISKKHARLVIKDGKVIIVDLKSTNGTFVNGRKVVSPLVIKDDDKIYVGDYILRIDGDPNEMGAMASDAAPPEGEDEAEQPSKRVTAQRSSEVALGLMQQAAAGEPPALPPSASQSSSVHPATQARMPSVPPPSPRLTPSVPVQLTRSSLSNIGDERPNTIAMQVDPVARGFDQIKGPQKGDPQADSPAMGLRYIMQRLSQNFGIDFPEAPSSPRSARQSRARELIDSITNELDAQSLLSSALDIPALREAALREAVFFGALTPWLEDETIKAISIQGAHNILLDHGQGFHKVDAFFSTQEQVRTILARICARSGQSFSNALSFGTWPIKNNWLLTVISHPLATQGLCVELQRQTVQGLTLDELKQRNVLDDAAMTVIRNAHTALRNIFVCGTHPVGVSTVLNALALQTPASERLICVESLPRLRLESRPYALRILAEQGWADAVSRLRLLGEARIVIDAQGMKDTHVAISSAATLREGLCVAMRAEDSQDLLKTMGLVALAGGIAADAVSAFVGEAVQLIVAVEAGGSAAFRIASITEVRASDSGLQTRDVYSAE